MNKLFMILPLALILCFMVGCQDKEAMAELEAMKAQAGVEEQNKELMIRLFEELDKQNFEFVSQAVAGDFLWHISGSPEPLDKETVLQIVKRNYEAFPDFTHTIEDILAKGDKVVVRMTDRGTHKGEFAGIPPTGNTVEMGAIYIWRVKDGKMVELWYQQDTLTEMQQLGRELMPKEEK